VFYVLQVKVGHHTPFLFNELRHNLRVNIVYVYVVALLPGRLLYLLSELFLEALDSLLALLLAVYLVVVKEAAYAVCQLVQALFIFLDDGKTFEGLGAFTDGGFVLGQVDVA